MVMTDDAHVSLLISYASDTLEEKDLRNMFWTVLRSIRAYDMDPLW